ncbi:MAG: SMP-30/gluconolactonase/LRE family protein [Myxococcota bacterium]|nr:SMP-30/gluconolactonase/LRE family protein [Myxococcota bacterium]
MRIFLTGCAVLALVVVGFFVFTPSPIDARFFDAGPAPALEGVLAPNDALAACEIFAADEIVHPEELEIDAIGRVYASTADGTIVRLSIAPDGSHDVEVYARPGGRPNGISFGPAGRLLVSDGWDVGPSWVHPDGRTEPFPVEHGQASAIGSDGTVYLPRYANARRVDHLGADVLLRIAEAAPDGELLAWDPVTGKTKVLMTGLIWPDGVALSAAEDFVVVGEVTASRIQRFWLRGPKRGTQEVFVENLPGNVDGLTSDGAGLFYASIPVRRSPLLDWFHRRPWAKSQASKLLSPRVADLVLATTPGAAQGYGLVLVIDEDGRIVRSLHDAQTAIGPGVNAAEPHGDVLYIASLGGRGIGRCPL